VENVKFSTLNSMPWLLLGTTATQTSWFIISPTLLHLFIHLLFCITYIVLMKDVCHVCLHHCNKIGNTQKQLHIGAPCTFWNFLVTRYRSSFTVVQQGSGSMKDL